MNKFLKVFGFSVLGLVVLALLIQLVPYGRDHTNPPVVQEPQWDNPRTRQLATRACFDCHSNETVWPWYSNIAPVSWLVQRDVEEGRSRLNFSDWNSFRGGEVGEVGEIVAAGEMPPAYYLIQHPTAKLTAQERQELIQGLEASLAR